MHVADLPRLGVVDANAEEVHRNPLRVKAELLSVHELWTQPHVGLPDLALGHRLWRGRATPCY